MSDLTCEQWLNNLIEEFRPIFEEAGHPLPESTIAVPTQTVVGVDNRGVLECDGEYLVFIPQIVKHPPIVAEILFRELVRCAVGIAAPLEEYNRLSDRFGTYAVTLVNPIKDQLNTILAEIGPYPEK